MNGNDNRHNTSQYNTYGGTAQTSMHTTRSTQTGVYKKGKKRFKPTKEGMLALAELFLIILVVFLVIFLIIKGITGRNNGGKETTTTTTTSTTETVVETPKWNSGYVSVSADMSVHEGSLILVNNNTEYTFPTKMESKLTDLYGKTDGNFVLRDSSIQLNRTIIARLSAMCAALKAANQDTLGAYTDKFGKTVSDKILISSGYRSKVYQQTLFNEAVTKGEDNDEVYVAKAGFSEHHTGLAVDIKIFTSDTKTVDLRANEYAWITANCWKYGFIQRYTDSKFDLTGISGEEWHYRFIDVPHAQEVSSLGICFEEYITLLKSYTVTSEAPYEIKTESGSFYVYYVPADTASDITYIAVPQGAKKVDTFAGTESVTSGMYTVSGNNIDGFIVTVAK